MYLNGKKVFVSLNNKRTLPIVVGSGEQPFDEYDITLSQDTGLTVKFLCSSIIDWGDGSTVSGNTHTYSNYGSYTIKANGTLGSYAFRNENDEHIDVLTRVKFGFPNLYESCFALQENLHTVIFSGLETSIPTTAFYACRSLGSIVIPIGVTSIGNSAFISAKLTSITIPSGVLSIGARAFEDCRVTTITIPSGVQRIENRLFYENIKLAHIYLPNTINYIGSQPFYACNSDGSGECEIHYNGTMAQWGNIEKANDWDTVGTHTNLTVHCTDGDI